MNKAKPFESPDLEALAKALDGAATHAELNGLFHAARLTEPEPHDGLSKWKRIFNSVSSAQNKTGTGNFALRFVQLILSPTRFVNHPATFDELRDKVNRLLAFRGWPVPKIWMKSMRKHGPKLASGSRQSPSDGMP
jgi:hypothetical protein